MTVANVGNIFICIAVLYADVLHHLLHVATLARHILMMFPHCPVELSIVCPTKKEHYNQMQCTAATACYFQIVL